MLLAIERHPNGPRVRIARQRIHHGAVGTLLLTTRNRYAALIGAALMLHDIHDFPRWFQPGSQTNR